MSAERTEVAPLSVSERKIEAARAEAIKLVPGDANDPETIEARNQAAIGVIREINTEIKTAGPDANVDLAIATVSERIAKTNGVKGGVEAEIIR